MITPQLIYFVGYFYGGGGLKDICRSYLKTGRREYKLIISDEFLVQIGRIRNIFFELFGLMHPIRFERILKGEHAYYLNPINKQIYLFLTDYFGLPKGPKDEKLEVPKSVLDLPVELRKWFVRGLFDADGDARAVEAGFRSQSRVKLRMTAHLVIAKVKELLEKDFGASVNGPYFDKGNKSSYIPVERFSDMASLDRQILFYHPIKRWRLEKMAKNPMSYYKAQHLKQFAAKG